MKGGIQIILLMLILEMLSVSAISSMNMEKDTLFSYGYLGAGAGIPAGLSSFTSFGRYHSNIGYGATIYGGYRFNSMFSVEMSLFSGHMNLFTTPCCSFYWMGSDGERYKRPLTSAESYSYKDIFLSFF